MAEDPNNKFFTMMPLDMLAEVASATLKSDPSLSFSSHSPESSCNYSKICSPTKKSANSSEKLTLDQIRALSDKMLLEMFSELTSDEIRKNYSFQCFMMPDKCEEIFTSFGNETRSRLQMKNHLLSHINDLVAETNDDSCSSFTAEPLHVRKKRLNEQSPKFPRKKKTKQQTAKRKKSKVYNKKKEDSKTNYHRQVKDDGQNSCQSSKNVHIGVSSKNRKNKILSPIKKCNSSITLPIHPSYDHPMIAPSHQKFFSLFRYDNPKKNCLNNFFRERTCRDLNNESYLSPSDDDLNCDEDLTVSINETKYKRSFQSCNPSGSGKWSTDYEDSHSNDDSAFTDTGSQYQLKHYFPSNHDHTYTSVTGKTYTCDFSLAAENARAVGKTFKDFKKSSHRCSGTAIQLIIPTPPFPFVYVPLLPHISEIKEVGNNCKTFCDKCVHNNYIEGLPITNSPDNDFHCETVSSDENEKQYHAADPLDETEIDTDDDENTLSDSLAEDDISDDDALSETSDSKIPDDAFSVDDLKINCPENLQAAEKKLALKYIRALRTKKKDERGPLVCQICKNKSFTAQATLMYHYRSHAGLRQEIRISDI